MQKLLLVLFVIFLTINSISSDTLLVNGDFENNYVSDILPDGRVRMVGWTGKFTNGGRSSITLEGDNSISALNVSDTKYDNTSDGADPYTPYIDSSNQNLDYFGFVRPSGPAPTSSYGELYSDVFYKQGNIQMDVWREASASATQVRFHDANTDALLGQYTFTGGDAVHHWKTVTFDLSSSGMNITDGTELYIVLKGGTYSSGSGYLSLFDNIYGGISQTNNIPDAGGGDVIHPELSVTNTNFGNVRMGTSANATVTVTNSGESGTTLNGNINASSGNEFSPTSVNQNFSLGSNDESSCTFTYTPSSRGSDSATVNITTTEDGDQNVTLTASGVSPVFNSSITPDSTIDFGMIHLNTSVLDHPDIPPIKYETITISNVTTDADLNNLTDLSILNAYITGDSPFDIINFTPTVLGKNQSLEITIRYSSIVEHNNGIAPLMGIKNAVLTLVTDQNAAFGQAGDIFTFNLTGEVVPELNSLFLLGIAFVTGLISLKERIIK